MEDLWGAEPERSKNKSDYSHEIEEARRELVKTPMSSIGRIMKLNAIIEGAQKAIADLEEADRRLTEDQSNGEPVQVEEYDAWGCGWS